MPINDLSPLTENILPTSRPQSVGNSIPNPYMEGSGNGDSGSKRPDYLPPLASGKDEMPITATSGQLHDARKFSVFDPTKTENEFAYGQGFVSKMVSGVGKGLLLTGTTFLQTTAGLINGLYQWNKTGKASSFYDNPLNKWVDDVNAEAENRLPNLYTNIEKDANWYSPKYLLTGNFLWDGIVKNLGFSAGAALSGMAFAGALRALPLTSKLFSIGKGAEALAATEEGVSASTAAGNAAETYGKIKEQSDKFLGSFKLLNPGGRALIAGLSTSGEASFESYQNLNQFRNDEIKKYQDTHDGEKPTGEDLKKINDNAEHVGNVSYLSNVALLSVTNYIQFPKILGSSYKAEKGMINSLTKETGDIIGTEGKYLVKPAGNKILSTLNKIRPYTFSTSEGFEEGAQYVIQEGTQNYYDKKYNNTPTDFLTSLLEGVKKTVGTNEGMKNILIGGLSGSIMMGRGRFRENSEKDRNTQEAVTAFNKTKFSDFTQETLDAVNRGTTLQEEREAALKSGDILNSKDKEADYIINYLTPRIKYGRFDLIKSDISDYKQLASTDEGFAQLQSEGKALTTDTKEAYIQRLSALEATAENVKSLYQSLNLRYGAQIDEKGKPIYSPAVMDKMVYAASKVADYDKRIPELTNTLIQSNIDVNAVVKDVLLGKSDSFNEAMDSISKMDILDEEKTSLSEALEDISELSLRRNKFLKEYTEIKNNPKKYQEQKAEDIQPPVGEENRIIAIKTKTGDKELTIGKEYFIGKGFDYDKDGLETPVTISKLTILSENEDGTIKVKGNNGKVMDISKDQLLDYKVTPAEQLKANKTANYFFNHRNELFEINLGKKYGGKKTGRIEFKEGKLFIVYKGVNGKLIHKEINNSFFVPQKEYNEPRIRITGKIETAEQKVAREEFTSAKELEAQKQTASQNRDTRIEILTQLFDDISTKQEDTNKLLTQKKSELTNIKEELSKLEENILNTQNDVDKRFKKVTFRATTRKALATASRLSRMQDQLEKEIKDLETQREELDIDLSYISDMAQNIDELPTDSKEFLNELKSHKALLEDMLLNTEIQIEETNNIISKVKAALDSAMDFLSDVIGKFQQKFPKVPLALGSEWIEFLKNNPNFLKRKPNYKEELQQLDDLVAQVEDMDIIPGERTIKELNEKLAELQEALSPLERELKASNVILDRFREIAKKSREVKAEEKAMSVKDEFLKKALGTDKSGIQNREFDKDYEPEAKKPTEFIWRSTITTGDKPHAIRSNKFGANLNSFPNRDKIRGVYITFKNEDQILPGLIDHLRTDENGNVDNSINREDVIVLVMTDEDGNLIDENGKLVQNNADKLNTAIYQVFPEAKLAWSEKYGNASMFRKDTPQDVVDSVKKQYADWRKDILENTTDLSNSHTIDASFGFPEYETELDENQVPQRIYSTKTSVQEAGLVTEDELEASPVITIPTTNSIVGKGTVSFTNAIGKVFLELKNGLIPLQNRKHTSEEAELIYQSIYHLAKNMLKGELKSDASENLFNYLRSVVYWGIPTDQQGNRKETKGYNSIFWEKDPVSGKFMLSMSGKGMNFVFTPSALEQYKADIIAMLEGMYNNINSSMIKGNNAINEKYHEPLSINADGTFNTREWNNYQTYLLSSTTPDGKPRKNIPLTTLMKPLANKEDVNRKGIYFYTTDTADDIVLPTKKPLAASKMLPGKLQEALQKTQKFVLGRNNLNIFTTDAGKQLKFIVSEKVNANNFMQEISILQGGDLVELMDIIKKAGLDPAKVLKRRIFKALEPQLNDTNTEEKEDIFRVPDDEDDTKIPTQKDNRKTSNEDDEEMEVFHVPDDIDEDIKKALNRVSNDSDLAATRLVLKQMLDDYKEEDWTKIEQWLRNNFPNFPFYRVKNVIQVTNGRQAWGMFKQAALYVYQHAESGTSYHEVFHAVWRMFVGPDEQSAIEDEFTSRKGSFIDRATQKTIKYSDANAKEIDEKLAEEFRNYIQEGKIPGKPEKGRPFILKMFIDLVKFIKTFFVGNEGISNTENLFKHINEGYYKKVIPYTASLSLANKGIININNAIATTEDNLSVVSITDKQRSDIIQEMTYQTLKELIESDKSLFTVPNLKKSELYSRLKSKLLDTLSRDIKNSKKLIAKGEFTENQLAPLMYERLSLMQNVATQWDAIVAKHQEYLRGYSIEFDDNDSLQINDEDKIKNSDFVDATKIDSFKKANSAIKLLLATLPKVDGNNRLIPSSIGGAQLLPISQTYISLMNRLYNSKSIEDMMSRLKDMATNDVNYRTLYKRLTKSDWKTKGIDISKINTTYGAQLLGSFWKTFKKQNPDVKNVFIFENGEIVIGDSNLSSVASQLRNEYINDIILTAKKDNSYFKYDEKEKVFRGDAVAIKNVKLDTLTSYSEFLNKLGIVFTVPQIQKLGSHLKDFKETVSGIRASIAANEKIATFSGKVLNINGRLLELGIAKAVIDNPEFDSTFFNVTGERTQSFIGVNPADALYNFLSSIEKFDDANVLDSEYRYLKTDAFAKGSNILQRMFTSEGTRKHGSEDLMKVGYVSGTIDEKKGKQKASARLNYKERLIQEINLNLKGWYLNLVPADATMEWMLNTGNAISVASISKGLSDVNAIFKNYFISEMDLVKDNRKINSHRDAKEAKEMRFFKSILGEELHNKIVKDKRDSEEIYADYESKINSALEKYINNETSKFQKNLTTWGVLTEDDLGHTLENINLPENMSMEELVRQLKALTINFMISNIEMHKLLYADPYQYYQELKRIKNFNSPRQTLINNSPQMNAVFNSVWNENYKKGDIGYTNFRQDYFRSATHKDTFGVIDLLGYTDFEETDGAGIIGMRAYRQFRIRSGDWNDNEESQYRYDIAWEKRDKDFSLSASEVALLEKGNPAIQSAYVNIKPIVAGNRLNSKGNANDINDVLLDKFALYPLSYRIMKEINPNANAIKLYDKMQKEDIDYMVFEKSRVVGARDPHDTYNADGSFNTKPYSGENVINVPFSIMSVQSEVPSKEKALTTRGSQITKLVTMDFMEAGVPLDFDKESSFLNRYKAWYKLSEDQKLATSPLYKDIMNNQDLLELMMEHGYQTLLNRLGIKESNGKFSIEDLSDAVSTLREEVLKREVNDNISDALTGFLEGQSILEATPAYQQIRNILYSIADKEIISPKISGGMKVQIPSTMMESVRAEETTINGKRGFTSDFLNFYKDEDGKRVCEIMIGRWFKSSMSDAELLDYLNNSEEGKSILSGLGFRIPTQKQNSIDNFVIKQFLPKEFGDSVVIPAALVQKAGSDFDIDKLSVYLKNIFKDVNGDIRLVSYKGSEKATKDYYSEVFSDKIEKQIENLEKQDDKNDMIMDVMSKLETLPDITISSAKAVLGKEEYHFYANNLDLLYDILERADEQEISGTEYIQGRLNESGEKKAELFTKLLLEDLRKGYIDRMYKKSLENAYIQSSQNLVSHKLNFDKLIKPNSADQMKKLSAEIAKKTLGSTFDYNDVGNMLDRGFMSRLRHAFVSGKYAIGIAAVNQTNHSLNQRQPIYIDKNRFNKLSEEDKYWLVDGEVRFDKFNRIEVNGKIVPTLSMIKNVDGQYISDIISQFIDGYVDIAKGPWIMELGATPNVASTFMFLAKLGVPIDTVSYFMNQPIIRDYLSKISNAGYSWLFIDNFVEELKQDAKWSVDDRKEADLETVGFKGMGLNQIPSKSTLKNNIGKEDFNAQERLEQRFILQEFLKYAKMAEHMFLVTQGSNFDTANFNDPYLVFKKFKQLEKAQNTIISDVNTLLNNSFVGQLSETIKKTRNALATILKSDQDNVRRVIQKVLEPYVNMNNNDFVKLAQKAVNDLFDWAVQTGDEKLNADIRNVLITNGGVGAEVMEFVNSIKVNSSHPLHDNHVINIIQAIPSPRAEQGGVNNLKVKGTDNKVYDQNNIIYGFREIREYLKDKNSKLYDRIKLLAVLQSGLSNSAISFTSLLPYEDFAELYNKTLSSLEKLPNLEEFFKLGVFERNNWNNDDIIPYTKARIIKTASRSYYNPAMEFLDKNVKEAVRNKKIPPVMTLSTRNREANSDHIVFTWEKQEDLLTEAEKSEANKNRTSFYKAVQQKKLNMRKIGDYSFIQKGLFKKIYDNFGTALQTTDKKGTPYFVYKAINAWGDSYRANEFYTTDHHSVIENGFIKVEDVDNNRIIDLFNKEEKTTAVSSLKRNELLEDYSQKTGEILGVVPIKTLKDGKTYTFAQINSKMLEEMKYTPNQIGEILKSIC